MAAAPFNSGLLSRTYPASDATFDDGSPSRTPPWGLPLCDPGVACVVAGFRTPEEVVSAPRWAAAELTEDAWSDLDAAAALEPQVPSV
ncbi:hypothetical protein [Streptomyces sp. NPDC001642]|uniref:hypothetical protein n=1 Tax=Streptomyces sp. NPDC001642 TaxID=3154392 RepID=UPI00387E747B